jgi:hypothetical protein
MTSVRVRAGALVWLALAACRDGDALLGAFHGAASDAGTCALDETAALTLPFTNAPFDDLPGGFRLGGLTFARGWRSSFDAEPDGWTRGAGAYSSSLTEFGARTVAVAGGVLRLTIERKAGPSGITSRAHWGAEVGGPVVHGRGAYVARLRVRRVRDVMFATFIYKTKTSPEGADLGWTGALFEIGDQGNPNVIFHDSATGRRLSRRIDLPGGPGAASVDELHTYTTVSLPGRVLMYVDGVQVAAWSELPAAAPWGFRFTYWINDGGRPVDDAALPVHAEIDHVAFYEASGCP